MVTEQKARFMEATAEIKRGVTRRQLDPKLFFTHLTPLEQKLFLGGSVYRKGTEGEFMSDDEIFQSDVTIYIRPAGNLSVGQITKERRNTFIEGFFPIFHSPAMSEKGYKHKVYLPVARNGRIEPRFIVHLLTAEGKLVKEQEVIDEVIQNFPQDYREYFTLISGRIPGELMLAKKARVASSPVAV